MLAITLDTPVGSSVYGFILSALFNIIVMRSCQLIGQLPYIGIQSNNIQLRFTIHCIVYCLYCVKQQDARKT